VATKVDKPTAAGVRRAVRAWARSVEPDLLPDVAGASDQELRELAALGGLAAVLGHEEGPSWPDAIVRWAFHAPRPPESLLDVVERAFGAGLDPLAESYNASISASNRRRLGTVFTPDDVVQHMLDLVEQHLNCEPATVVDPGAGVGAFTLAAARRWPGARVVAIDVNPVTLGLLAARIAYERRSDESLAQVEIDLWLADYMQSLPRLFTATSSGPIVVLGNPPYTRAQALSADYKQRAAELAGPMITSGHANLAMLFQALTMSHLRPGDLSCMVLPASMMYTRAARDLRRAIWTSRRPVVVDRWPARARAFIGRNVQAAVVLLGPESDDPGPMRFSRVGTSGGEVETIDAWDLDRSADPPSSWYAPNEASAHRTGARELGEVTKVRRGVATGANSVFFLDDETASVMPEDVLSRAVATLRSFTGTDLTAAIHDDWGAKGARRWLLTLDPSKKLPDAVRGYMEAHRDVEDRHLCQQRAKWWAITDLPRPNILISPLSKNGFKIVVNSVNAVPSNNLLGISVFSSPSVSALATWLRSVPGQEELLRVSRRYHGGSYKIEPGDLKRVRLPLDLSRSLRKQEGPG
jgi:adenine-specific DNA-methyltransferase